MWKKGKSDGASGVRSMIKQARKDFKLQGIKLVMDEDNHDQGTSGPKQFENIQLKNEPTEEEKRLVQANLQIRETIHKSVDYILFSKPTKPKTSISGCSGLESDEFKKSLSK